jgi:hypothetical protein
MRPLRLPICCTHLSATAGKGARGASLSEDEAAVVKGLGLLTLKPLIYAANVGEDDLGNHGANNTHVQVRGACGVRGASHVMGWLCVRTCACAPAGGCKGAAVCVCPSSRNACHAPLCFTPPPSPPPPNTHKHTITGAAEARGRGGLRGRRRVGQG